MIAERGGGSGGALASAPLGPDVQRFYVVPLRGGWAVRDAAASRLEIVFIGSWVACDEEASRRNAGR